MIKPTNGQVKNLGGGWYETPDGRKVQGRAKAEGVSTDRLATMSARDLLAVLSTQSTRSRLLSGMRGGLQYQGARDIFTTAGYVRVGQETFDVYWNLYERNEVAGRIIDLPAQQTWHHPPDVLEDGKTLQESDFAKQFLALASRLNLWVTFDRLDRLASIGEYAVLFFGTRVGQDRELATPLVSVADPQDLMYLNVFPQKLAEIKKFVQDLNDPRYGLPEMYEIDVGVGDRTTGAGESSRKVPVHYSRVLHVAQDKVENGVYGRPALKRALNRLFDLDKVAAATGEAYWQLAVRVLQGKIDPNFDLGEGDVRKQKLAALGGDLEEVIHDLRRHFIGQGVELEWLNSTPPDPTGATDLYMSLVAVACGIPKRILFGSERGELASSQDQRTFHALVDARRQQFAEPDIVHPFVDKCVTLGILPTPDSEPTATTKEFHGLAHPGGNYVINWPPLGEMTEDERAKTNKTRAETAKDLAGTLGNPLALVDISEEGDIVFKPTTVGGAPTVDAPAIAETTLLEDEQ